MMTPIRRLIMMLFVMLAVSCGSDVEMDNNLPDPPPPPGQNPPTPQDADNDGVADADDQCPETPAGENVDESGCSDSQKDSDGDGVNDDADQCPDTPSGTAVDENGCEEGNDDGDGDGVPNDDDECPNTPEGEEVDENGCASSQADSDGDGIADPNDDCPDTPEGEAVDESGCADSQKDSDSDGVSDADDQCPNTPEGADVDENGCEEGNDDGDGDGVPNDDDDCPDTPEGAEVDENGCSASQLDADGDGVADDDDDCPETPEGEEADENGCSDSQKDDDNDGVSNADDQCPDTAAGATVNEEGCSDAQSDTDPPVVTGFEVTEITPTFFKVEWNLDEGSKGYIRFGTVSGNYDNQTATEENYLTRHVQTVGGSNPEPLQPSTTYYWQIYVEDEAGNSGFSEEQSTTTAEEVQGERTYVPDDGFERFLIYAGYDDVMDDYVLTENISGITRLYFDYYSCFEENDEEGTLDNCDWEIRDFTGLQDFVNLEEVSLFDAKLDLVELKKWAPQLKTLGGIGYYNDQPITGWPELVSVSFVGNWICDCGGRPPAEISNNPKLQEIDFGWIDGSSIISNNPNLQSITVNASYFNELSISDNQNLQTAIISGGNNGDTKIQNLSFLNNSALSRLQFDSGASIENLYIRDHMLEYICIVLDSSIDNLDVVPEVPIRDECN